MNKDVETLKDDKNYMTNKKIGKITYEVVVKFNKNSTETMKDKIMQMMLEDIKDKND